MFIDVSIGRYPRTPLGVQCKTVARDAWRIALLKECGKPDPH